MQDTCDSVGWIENTHSDFSEYACCQTGTISKLKVELEGIYPINITAFYLEVLSPRADPNLIYLLNPD